MKILVIIAVVAVALGLVMAWQNMKIPSGLGVIDGKLSMLPKTPNAVSSQTDDSKRRVAPFQFKDDLVTTRRAILESLARHGDMKILEDGERYIHAVSTTRFMKFHDDLEFFFDENSGVVHFRSASRVGYSDLGMNRKRYEQLVRLYQ